MKEESIKLITILKEEITLYQIFLDLLERERNIVAHFSLEDMYENNNQKETVLLQIKVLEESRISLVESFGEILDIPREEITISMLCAYIYEPYRTELKECHQRLSALINSIKEVNQVNSILIDRSISFLRDSFSLINSFSQSSLLYHSSGKIEEQEENGRILCKRG
ncbi:MAG: flagellar protein FlgN [Nitrospirota bacterium]